MYTDRDGKIDLGPLDNIIQVYASFDSAYGNCSRTWNIPYLKEMIDYPQNIEVLEEEPIEIPVPAKELTHSDLSLVKYSASGQTIDNKFDNFSLDASEGHGFGTLTIGSLDRGSYTLSIKKLNISISITVHEGVYWEAEGFVLKKNSIVEVKHEPKYLRIHNIAMTKSEENKEDAERKAKLKFSLSNTNDTTRAHVFAFTYLPNQPSEPFKCMRQLTKSYKNSEVFPFTKWQNVYQSNRKLGDEYRYVFNRKNAKRFTGNTLERPQLIMKRLKVRDTTFDTEVIREGAAYHAVQAEKLYNLSKTSHRLVDSSSRGFSGGIINQSNIERLLSQQNSIYGFQNFLKHATLVHKNLHPSADGSIECEIDADNYTNVLILATSEKSNTQVIYDIENPQEEVQTRNLSLTDPLDCNKYFNEVRNTDNVAEGQAYNIQDITSTEYIFVDSIDKVKKVSDDICKIRGTSVDDSLFFLLNWNTFSEDQKNRKYTEFQCHEVNLFLYFKDYDYFVRVVKPFIASKMEKTFIDHWLLQENEEILHYQEIGHFDKLNALEQSLLIFSVLNDDPYKAQVLASRIQQTSDSLCKHPVEFKNRLFDTVLSLNLLQKDASKLELLEQIKQKEVEILRCESEEELRNICMDEEDDYSDGSIELSKCAMNEISTKKKASKLAHLYDLL